MESYTHTVTSWQRMHAPGRPGRLYTDSPLCFPTARVSDMAVVRTLTADTDEINVALWSPEPGGGIVYGTKQGRLRRLQLDKGPLLLKPHMCRWGAGWG